MFNVLICTYNSTRWREPDSSTHIIVHWIILGILRSSNRVYDALYYIIIELHIIIVLRLVSTYHSLQYCYYRSMCGSRQCTYISFKNKVMCDRLVLTNRLVRHENSHNTTYLPIRKTGERNKTIVTPTKRSL